MSEHQYYEFVALDRPLTAKEQKELRAISSRAEIDSRSFKNTYDWGDLRADPEELVAKYFDAHFYAAVWGGYTLIFRFPRRLVDETRLRLYETEYSLSVLVSGEFCLVRINAGEREEVDEVPDIDEEEFLPALLPLRSDILRGDMRCLYLAWLMGMTFLYGEGDYEEDSEEEREQMEETEEPPVPPGLNELTPALKTFVELFDISPDLIAVAAERSAPLKQAPFSDEKFGEWLVSLPQATKDELLKRAVLNEETGFRLELQSRFERETRGVESEEGGEKEPPRTVAELMEQARQRREEREEREAKRRKAQRERKAREAALARQKYLDSLAGQESQLWQKVDALIASKQLKSYDEAVKVLHDLRDLAQRGGRVEDFEEPMRALRERYKNRPALLSRFEKAKI